MRRHISHSYISADWASLKWPRRRQYTGFKFHGCLWEREFADNRHDGPAAALGKSCVWKSVPSPAMLAWFSLTKINRCSHCQIQYSETGSALQQCDSGHVNDSTVLEKLRWPTAQTDASNCNGTGDRPSTTRDFKGSYSALSAPSPSSSLQGRPIMCFASFAAWSVL